MPFFSIARNAFLESIRQPVHAVLICAALLALVLNVNVAAYTLEASFLVRNGPAPETIISVLEQGGYDLLFIGAYGQARLLEMVLGSTTEFVLRSAPCPVVLTR